MVNYFRYLYDYYRFGFDKCRNNRHNPVMTQKNKKVTLNKQEVNINNNGGIKSNG